MLTRACGVAVVVALVLAPQTSHARHGGGIVPSAHFESEKIFCALSFAFSGRVPVGKRYYQVTSGNGFGHGLGYFSGCDDFSISMTGDTPSGSFQWECVGYMLELQKGVKVDYDPVLLPTYLVDARCVTLGHAGGFALKVVLHAYAYEPSPIGVEYSLAGVLHTVLTTAS